MSGLPELPPLPSPAGGGTGGGGDSAAKKKKKNKKVRSTRGKSAARRSTL